MRILQSLTYYRPHISGLTIYVQRLSETLVAYAHQVTVLTSKYDPNLSNQEEINGVKVIRVPVLFRLNKGVVMPSFWLRAIPLIFKSEVVHLHLPQIEAADLALLAKLLRKKVIVTYHCDITLPGIPFKRLFGLFIQFHHFVTCLLADVVVTYTQDYANHSRLLKLFRHKLKTIYPPVILPTQPHSLRPPTSDLRPPILGMATRFAQDKGIEYALAALKMILPKYPQAKLLFAGQSQGVLGEWRYLQKLTPLLQELDKHLEFLGVLSQAELVNFYQRLDLLIISSINSTESFGLVQVEAMLCGVPVVATNLSGVRQPVLITGMGKIAEVANSQSLAQGILEVLENKPKYLKSRKIIAEIFSLEKTVEFYERLYKSTKKGR